MRCFPAPKTEVMTGRTTLLASWDITYVLKNKRSSVSKWKLNTSTFKMATLHQNLGTKGIKATLCHKTSNICSFKKWDFYQLC